MEHTLPFSLQIPLQKFPQSFRVYFGKMEKSNDIKYRKVVGIKYDHMFNELSTVYIKGHNKKMVEILSTNITIVVTLLAPEDTF